MVIKYILNLLFGDVLEVRRELLENRLRNNGESRYVPRDCDPEELEILVRKRVKEHLEKKGL